MGLKIRTKLSLKVRAGRIELPSRPWQGRVLPLNHARKSNHRHYTIKFLAVHLAGFEPTITVPKTVVISISPQVQ